MSIIESEAEMLCEREKVEEEEKREIGFVRR
jgi:hypothetical protein